MSSVISPVVGSGGGASGVAVSGRFYKSNVSLLNLTINTINVWEHFDLVTLTDGFNSAGITMSSNGNLQVAEAGVYAMTTSATWAEVSGTTAGECTPALNQAVYDSTQSWRESGLSTTQRPFGFSGIRINAAANDELGLMFRNTSGTGNLNFLFLDFTITKVG